MLQPLQPDCLRAAIFSTGETYSGFTVVAHPTQPFLYAATYGVRTNPVEKYGTLAQYRVEPDGRLKWATALPVPAGSAIGGLSLDPRGRFLYAILEGGRILAYPLRHNATAGPAHETRVFDTFDFMLSPEGGALPGISYGDLVFAPSGRFAYAYSVSNGGIIEAMHSWIAPYRVLSNGSLRRIAAPIGNDLQIGSFILSPSSQFAYAADLSETVGLTAYRIRSNGVIAPATISVGVPPPARIGSTAVAPSPGFVFAPKSRLAYQLGRDRLRVYRAARNGTLALLSQQTIPGSCSITFGPTGAWAFVGTTQGLFPHETWAIQTFRVAPGGALQASGPPYELPITTPPSEILAVIAPPVRPKR